jgi:hypothetical protein
MSQQATITITGSAETLQTIGARQAVVLPLEEYEALLQRLKDLEDILDSEAALAEYQTGQGKSLDQFLAAVTKTPSSHYRDESDAPVVPPGLAQPLSK